MAITRYLFASALAIATTTATACSIDKASTTTITAATAVSALVQCATFSGNIALQTGSATGNVLNLDGIQQITGDLSYESDHDVTSISAGQLKEVGGLILGDLPVLSTLSLTALTKVGNALNFTGLGTIQNLDFGNPGVTSAGSVTIVNTHLVNLQGLDQLSTVSTYMVNSNPLLNNIQLAVKTLDVLDIGANDVANGGLTTNFPNLQTASNITIRNATVVSMPALINTTGTLGFYGNDFKSFNATNLTSAGGVVFANNKALTNISLPALTTINDGLFQIANNTNLEAISGFDKLTKVGGNIDFVGDFKTVILPGGLQSVLGAVNVQTSEALDCAPIAKLGTDQIVQGQVTCAGKQAVPGGAGSTPSSTSSGSSSSSTGSSDASSFLADTPSLLLGSSSLLAALLQMLL